VVLSEDTLDKLLACDSQAFVGASLESVQGVPAASEMPYVSAASQAEVQVQAASVLPSAWQKFAVPHRSY